MPPPPARKADVIADDLLRRIVRGEHAVGSVLPKEAELAAHYAVNRSVVRDAIKLLEVHRLVRPVRRRGTEVLDPYTSLSPEVLRAMLVPAPGEVDRAVLASFLEVRAQLDEQMTVLAAERRTIDDLRALDALLAELKVAIGDRDRYEAVADRLARAIARATHNPIFEMLVCWNQTVASELPDLFRTVRPSNEPHYQAVALLVEQIRRREVGPIHEALRTFHTWATPRLLAAAALSTGEPLETVMAVMAPPKNTKRKKNSSKSATRPSASRPTAKRRAR